MYCTHTHTHIIMINAIITDLVTRQGKASVSRIPVNSLNRQTTRQVFSIGTVAAHQPNTML